MSEPRIACSLSPEAQERRFADFADLSRRALLGADRTPHGARIRLRNTDTVHAAVRRLIEAERECCSFLEFGVEATDDHLLIDVSGPPHARALIDRLFDVDLVGGSRG